MAVELGAVLCETPQRLVEQEFLDDVLARQVGTESVIDRYSQVFADRGLDGALEQLNDDIVIRAITVDWARIRKAHSIDPSAPGIVVGVKFLDGTQAMHDGVMAALEEWEQALDGALSFVVSSHANALRTTFAQGNKYVHATKIANRLVSIGHARLFETDPNAASARGIVLHEFGHALGLEHEHFSPHLAITWRPDQEIADHINTQIKPPTNWTKTMVRHNITGAKDGIEVCGDKLAFDDKSVMGYAIWPQWNDESISTAPANTLSQDDIACAQRLYPSGN